MATKAIRKNQLVEKTVEYLKLNIGENYINRSDIYAFKFSGDVSAAPYVVVDTSPTHPQPVQESQQSQIRYVNLDVSVFYPLDKSKVVVRTINGQDVIDTQTDAYIVAKKSVNNVTDDIIETLYSKAYISSIKMQGVAITNEGDVGIEENAAEQPVMIYTVEIETRSFLII